MPTHTGGCHCGAVRWSFDAPSRLTATDCDCSVCRLRAGPFVIVPETAFKLERGQGATTLYQFGTKTAKHLFCKTCGVTSYYRPRSNPDCVSCLVAAIDKGTVEAVETRHFHGQEWEASYKAEGAPVPCAE